MDTPIGSQITIVDQVYFQQDGSQPAPMEMGGQFTRRIPTDEQVYQRRMKVGEEWKTLEYGWIERCAMLIAGNEEGHFRVVNPTEEERAQAEAKVIEISLCPACMDADIILPPREHVRFQPSNFREVRLRCRSGEAKALITLIPGGFHG